MHELNQLKALINILVPQIYQNHYYTQPSPTLYEPFLAPKISNKSPATTEKTVITTTPFITTSTSDDDQLQNESPFVDNTENIINATTIMPNSLRNTTMSKDRILQFHPVIQSNKSKLKFPARFLKILNLFTIFQIIIYLIIAISFADKNLVHVTLKYIVSTTQYCPEMI